MSNFDQGLEKNPSNFIPLSPITFLERAKDVYPEYEALVYGDRKYTWKQVYERSTQFASSIEKQGIGLGDTVSVLAAKTETESPNPIPCFSKELANCIERS